MGLYFNGKQLGQPFLNGKMMNGFLNGKQLFKKPASAPEEIKNTWADTNGFISLGEDPTKPCTESVNNSWIEYGYKTNCNGTITYWTRGVQTTLSPIWWKTFFAGYMVSSNVQVGKYRITLKYVSGSITGDTIINIYFNISNSKIWQSPFQIIPQTDGSSVFWDFDWKQEYYDYWHSPNPTAQKLIFLNFRSGTPENPTPQDGDYQWNDWTFIPTMEYLGPLN